MRDRNGRNVRDRPFEFKDIEELSADNEPRIIRRELNMLYDSVKDFYVHDGKELVVLGSLISDSDMIMGQLSSDEINRFFEIGKIKFGGLGAKELKKLASSTHLMTLLAIYRAMYLEDEDERKNDKTV